VLRLVAEGYRTKDIAKKLGISPKTVGSHRSNLMSKLGLKSPIELAKYAANIGLTHDTDQWKQGLVLG